MKRILFYTSVCFCLTMNGCIFGIQADYESPYDNAIYWNPQTEQSQQQTDIIRPPSEDER